MGLHQYFNRKAEAKKRKEKQNQNYQSVRKWILQKNILLTAIS